MIYELYSFSPGTFVVADEWNANFKTLYNTSSAHTESIEDAVNMIAFYDSDMTDIYNAVRLRKDSDYIFNTNVQVLAGHEYYRTLGTGERLSIEIPDRGISGECRILIELQDQRTQLPFSVSYTGTTDIDFGYYDYEYFVPGYYYIMIYENNGLAQIKLIWTGA